MAAKLLHGNEAVGNEDFQAWQLTLNFLTRASFRQFISFAALIFVRHKANCYEMKKKMF